MINNDDRINDSDRNLLRPNSFTLSLLHGWTYPVVESTLSTSMSELNNCILYIDINVVFALDETI